MNNLAEEQEVISDENMQELPKKEETNADDFEVEIVDDTPEEDRVAKRKEEPEVSDDLDSFVKQAYAAIREDNNYMMQELRKE